MKIKPCWLWWLATLAIAAWLLWMTLRPQVQAQADLAYITTPAAAQGISIPFLINILGNVVVFMPLGTAAVFALQWRDTPPRPRYKSLLGAILIGAGLSVCIELTQSLLPSRVSTFNDWLLNTGGTLIGALIGTWWGYQRQRRNK